jgi:hypothetical protein
LWYPFLLQISNAFGTKLLNLPGTQVLASRDGIALIVVLSRYSHPSVTAATMSLLRRTIVLFASPVTFVGEAKLTRSNQYCDGPRGAPLYSSGETHARTAESLSYTMG